MAGRIVAAAAQAAVLVLLVRALGTSSYAPFALSFSLTTTIFVCLDLGFGAAVLRANALGQPRRLFGSLVVLRSATVILAGLGVTLLFSAKGEWHLLSLGLLGALYASGEALGDVAASVAQSELKSGKAVLILLSRRAAALCPLLLANTQLAAIIALVMAGGLGHSFFWVSAIRRAGKPLTIKGTFRNVGTLTVASVGTGITSADSFLVSLVTTAQSVTYYAAASRLANPVNLAVSTLMQVLVPHLVRVDHVEGLAAFRRARWLVLVLAIAVALSALLSSQFVNILYGPSFRAAAPVLAGVLIGAGISAFAQVHLAYLYARGITWPASFSILGASVAGLAGLVGSIYLGGLALAGAGIVWMQGIICVAIVIVWRASIRSTVAEMSHPCNLVDIVGDET